MATDYLNYLYSDVGQELAAKHFYRPTKPEIAAKYADKFANLDLVTVDKVFGGWKSVSRKYFGDRGIFDAIYEINQASR